MRKTSDFEFCRPQKFAIFGHFHLSYVKKMDIFEIYIKFRSRRSGLYLDFCRNKALKMPDKKRSFLWFFSIFLIFDSTLTHKNVLFGYCHRVYIKKSGIFEKLTKFWRTWSGVGLEPAIFWPIFGQFFQKKSKIFQKNPFLTKFFFFKINFEMSPSGSKNKIWDILGIFGHNWA